MVVNGIQRWFQGEWLYGLKAFLSGFTPMLKTYYINIGLMVWDIPDLVCLFHGTDTVFPIELSLMQMILFHPQFHYFPPILYRMLEGVFKGRDYSRALIICKFKNTELTTYGKTHVYYQWLFGVQLYRSAETTNFHLHSSTLDTSMK